MTESECSLFPPNNILKSIYLSIFYLTYSHLVRVCSRSIYLSIYRKLRVPTWSPRPAARDAMAAADPAANRADLIDRLLVGFVNVPAGVVLPMIGAIVSIMFYYFNNHMFQ